MILTDAELADLRAIAEGEMTDTAAFRRPTGRTAQNPTTWVEGPVYETLFTTRCRIGGQGGQAIVPRTVRVGDVERTVLEGHLHIPATSPGLREGDEVVIAAVGPGTDPSALGQTYRVVGFGPKSWAVKRSIDVVEV